MEIEEMIRKATELATTYGPAAWEQVQLLTRLNAVGTLVPTLIFLSAALRYAYVWKTKYIPEAQMWKQETGSYNINSAPWFMPRVIILILSGITIFICFVTLIDVWLWVALVCPDLFIAYKALSKVL